MKFKQHLRIQPNFSLDMAPFIAVIFQLVIFAVLLSPFTFPSGITVKLPKTVTSDVIKEENTIITITGENVTYLNGKIITERELQKILEKSDMKNLPILIKADRRASVGRIVDLWNMCRNNGIERINIATNQEN